MWLQKDSYFTFIGTEASGSVGEIVTAGERSIICHSYEYVFDTNN